ncbi:MAG: metallophosphoesterase family protein [Candidatus Hodarchaeales archaeon]|jgi:DNA repair exonuclease SbcCD nuclease subunit
MVDKSQRRMLKFLFLSDTHFGVHYAVKPRNKIRYQYGIQFFNKVDEIFRHTIRERKVDFILHGGDFFNRSKPPPEVVKRSTSLLLWASKYVPIYLIPGNHERSKLPIGLLEYQENIHIFSKPCSFIYEKDAIRIKLTGFPYIRHHGRKKSKSVIRSAWKNEIDSIHERSHYNILLMHQLIQGSRVEHYTFNRGHNVIRSSDIPPLFHLVATGHVHRYQILYGNYPRINSSHSRHRIVQDVTSGRWSFTPSKTERVFYYTNPLICYSGSSERVSQMERKEDKGYVIGKIWIEEKTKKTSVNMDLNFIPVPSTEMRYLKWNLDQKPLYKSIRDLQMTIQEMREINPTSPLAGVIHVSITNADTSHYSRISHLKKLAEENSVLLTLRIKD